jgi:hypothetical protein
LVLSFKKEQIFLTNRMNPLTPSPFKQQIERPEFDPSHAIFLLRSAPILPRDIGGFSVKRSSITRVGRFLALAGALALPFGPALAQPYQHGGPGWHGRPPPPRYYHGYRGGGPGPGAVVGGVVAGLAVGALIGAAVSAPPPVYYAAPPPPPPPPVVYYGGY